MFLCNLIGNPGVVEYYRDFMNEIYRLLQEEYPGEEDIPVVGISHGGHQVDEIDSASFPSVDGTLYLVLFIF